MDHTTHFDDCGCKSARLEQALADANKRADDAEREDNECHELNVRMSNLLTGVANALNGPPEPLSWHSWADLPERAGLMVENERRLIAEAQALKLRVAALEAALLALCGDGLHGEWPDDDDTVPKGWETWRLLLFGSEVGDHIGDEKAHKHLMKLISGDTTALRAMLVDGIAAYREHIELLERGRVEAAQRPGWRAMAEKFVAEWNLGASKGGGR